MEDALTWKAVEKLLVAKGRGAKYQLAQRLEIDPSAFSRKLKTNGEPSERQGRIIREFLNDEPPGQRPAPARDRRTLDVYGYAAGADGDLIALNPGEIIDTIQLPMGLELGPGDYFAVRAIGSSMEPRIFPGETLVVRRQYPPARDRDVIIEFRDGSGVVKIYDGQRDGQVFVRQFNPAKTIGYDASRVRALHAVAFKL